VQCNQKTACSATKKLSKYPQHELNSKVYQVTEGTVEMEAAREELMGRFMTAEQQKPALQSAVQNYLQAQMEFHKHSVGSVDKALGTIDA